MLISVNSRVKCFSHVWAFIPAGYLRTNVWWFQGHLPAVRSNKRRVWTHLYIHLRATYSFLWILYFLATVYWTEIAQTRVLIMIILLSYRVLWTQWLIFLLFFLLIFWWRVILCFYFSQWLNKMYRWNYLLLLCLRFPFPQILHTTKVIRHCTGGNSCHWDLAHCTSNPITS